MLVAVYITFDDIETIELSVNSVWDKVDRLIFVDGRFRDFPADNLTSEDGTHEYLLGLMKKDRNKVKLVQCWNQDEVGKRNIYLMMCREGDAIINLDADEVLVGDIPSLRSDIGKIIIDDGVSGRSMVRCSRFFRMKKGLHYDKKHYLIVDKDKQLFATLKAVGDRYSVQNIDSFRLKNLHNRRSAQRQLKKKIYYSKLVKRESKYSDFGKE